MSKDKEKEKINKRYSQEEKEKIVKDIVIQIKLENKSVRAVFSDDNVNKPCINRDTFYDWINNNKEFSDQYARAKEDRAEAIFEEILSISDDTMMDMVEVQQARLKIDARKWMLGKMMPHKYSDKINIDANLNANIDAKVQTNIDYSKLSTETLTDLLNNIQKND